MKGREIIKDVMRRYKIGPLDFFGYSRLPRLVQARRSAIRRMAETGMTVPVIARLMQRNERTVSYHLDPAQRKRSLARSARYYAERCDEKRSYWFRARKTFQETGATA